MERKNCWEVKKCGRHPGGDKIDELGVCPATMPSEYDGTNKGDFSGRFCWAVAGSSCDGEPKGTFAKQLLSCYDCEFFKQVNEEEGRNFILSARKLGLRIYS